MGKMIDRIFGVMLCAVLMTGCGENAIEKAAPDVQEETSEKEQTVVKEGYHTVEFRNLTFEIPDAWDKWGDDFDGGKMYRFSDIDNLESVFWFARSIDANLTTKDVFEQQYETFCNEYGNAIVNYGDIDGHDTALITFSFTLSNGTKRKSIAYYVSISDRGYAEFVYECDEDIDAEHKKEYEELIDSIRFAE